MAQNSTSWAFWIRVLWDEIKESRMPCVSEKGALFDATASISPRKYQIDMAAIKLKARWSCPSEIVGHFETPSGLSDAKLSTYYVFRFPKWEAGVMNQNSIEHTIKTTLSSASYNETNSASILRSD